MSKKQQILDAALRLFVEEGFEATATSRIAKEAGVATGTLFHHFENKDALVNAVYLDIKRDITAALAASLGEGDDLRERGFSVFRAFIDWAAENPLQFRFNSVFCESPAITRASRRYVVDVTSQVTRVFVEEGHARGIARELPVALLHAYASKMMVETARYFLEHPDARDDDALLERAFEAFWNMLAR